MFTRFIEISESIRGFRLERHAAAAHAAAHATHTSHATAAAATATVLVAAVLAVFEALDVALVGGGFALVLLLLLDEFGRLLEMAGLGGDIPVFIDVPAGTHFVVLGAVEDILGSRAGGPNSRVPLAVGIVIDVAAEEILSFLQIVEFATHAGGTEVDGRDAVHHLSAAVEKLDVNLGGDGTDGSGEGVAREGVNCEDGLSTVGKEFGEVGKGDEEGAELVEIVDGEILLQLRIWTTIDGVDGCGVDDERVFLFRSPLCHKASGEDIVRHGVEEIVSLSTYGIDHQK